MSVYFFRSKIKKVLVFTCITSAAGCTVLVAVAPAVDSKILNTEY